MKERRRQQAKRTARAKSALDRHPEQGDPYTIHTRNTSASHTVEQGLQKRSHVAGVRKSFIHVNALTQDRPSQNSMDSAEADQLEFESDHDEIQDGDADGLDFGSDDDDEGVAPVAQPASAEL